MASFVEGDAVAAVPDGDLEEEEDDEDMIAAAAAAAEEGAPGTKGREAGFKVWDGFEPGE